MKNKTLYNLKKECKNYDLDTLLGEISVIDSALLDLPDTHPMSGWFAVETTEEIVAWFSTEAEALRYRLDLINQILNT